MGDDRGMNKLEAELRDIAQEVYADLGSGHDEKVYRRAMEVDLRLRGIKYDAERVLELRYKDHYVGENYADLIVGSGNETVVVELKAVTCMLGLPERQQLRKYMKTLGVKSGLLINFQKPETSRKKRKEDGPEIVVP
jgi:GxxExxY protein